MPSATCNFGGETVPGAGPYLGDESLADLASPQVEHLHAAGGRGVQAVATVLGRAGAC